MSNSAQIVFRWLAAGADGGFKTKPRDIGSNPGVAPVGLIALDVAADRSQLRFAMRLVHIL